MPARHRTGLPMLLFVVAVEVSGGCAPSRPAPAAPPRDPIDHVVVLMQENRSFDSYLGQLHDSGQPDAEPEPPTASNPNPLDPRGPPVAPFHQTRYCEVADLEHSWTGAHQEWDGGAMDGFTAANATPSDPTGSRAMGYYTGDDLAYYYALYGTFAMADHYFSSVLGPTFPNRFFLLAGTSFGHIRNDLPPLDGFTQHSIFNLLDEAGVSWHVYYSGVLALSDEFSYVRAHVEGHLFPIAQYYAAAGQLPAVSFVDPVLLGDAATANDEHPPSNVQVGQSFTAGVVGALFQSRLGAPPRLVPSQHAPHRPGPAGQGPPAAHPPGPRGRRRGGTGRRRRRGRAGAGEALPLARQRLPGAGDAGVVGRRPVAGTPSPSGPSSPRPSRSSRVTSPRTAPRSPATPSAISPARRFPPPSSSRQ